MDLAHRLETLAVRAALALCRALGPAGASALGGFVARVVGPHLPVSRVARRNLRLAMPHLDGPARDRVVRGTWDNLGRTAAEFAHVATLRETARGPGYEVEGVEHVPLQGPALLVSGHLGNWEVAIRAAALGGLQVASFYRAAANTAVDSIIVAERSRANLGAPGFAKGAAGARAAVDWLRHGGVLGLLMDQKMNDGIAATLFGRTAMTAPAAAMFARRFRCPVVPVRVVRLGPARLRIICEPPLRSDPDLDSRADVAALTQAINDRLEAWIRERPEQWLWLHRRWPTVPGNTSGPPAPRPVDGPG